MARYHRKGSPGLGEFAALARDGDEEMLERCAAVLRLAEQLERPRDQTVAGLTVEVARRHASPCGCATPPTSPSRAGRPSASAALFEKVLGRELEDPWTSAGVQLGREVSFLRGDRDELSVRDGLDDLLLLLLLEAVVPRARRRR